MHVWTSEDGREVDGVMLSSTETHVKVRLLNGKVFDIPLERLVQSDRDFAAGRPVFEKTYGWLEDFERAKEEARHLERPILMLFTVSDENPYCEKLKEEILDTREFEHFAEKHLVLMEVDFPRRSDLGFALRNQNQELKREYRVIGYPTMYLVNEEGQRPLRVSTYFNGKVEEFLRQLERRLDEF